MLGIAWTAGQTAKLVALYIEDPAKPPLAEITARINAECGGNFTVRAVKSKIGRLGVAANPTEMWPDEIAARAVELYLDKNAGSYQVIAETLNTQFGTQFTRCAVIGKINRLGLSNRRPPADRPVRSREVTKRAPRERQRAERLARPPMESVETVKLRCVEITPLHLSLLELDHGLCKYPYGGDAEGEAISFCGHPSIKSRPYCMPHLALCTGHGTASERAATRVGAAA
jgi:GcrA cell cycle regulator